MSADFLTIDVFERPAGAVRRWRASIRQALENRPEGLRSVTVNYANNATHAIAPRLLPGGCAVVAAWDSADAAAEAWRGPLRTARAGARAYSLDGEITRVRLDNDGDTWHGWGPSAEGTTSLSSEEPMVAIVHGIVRPRHLGNFFKNNLHAASRAKHHPGHRGSVDISSALPFEHTSISLWETLKLARDYAYAPGAHSHAMKHALSTPTHRVGVFLQVRPTASSGCLGIDAPAFPDLPPAYRG